MGEPAGCRAGPSRVAQLPGDEALTYERSYLCRLAYVHQNAVHHGLVPVASQYRWCSAAWFERTATNAQVSTLYGLKLDRVHIPDDFDVA